MMSIKIKNDFDGSNPTAEMPNISLFIWPRHMKPPLKSEPFSPVINGGFFTNNVFMRLFKAAFSFPIWTKNRKSENLKK